MRTAAFVALALVAAEAPLLADVIEGRVVDVRSQWSGDRRTIFSTTSIERPDGTVEQVYQLGGSVDGVGMMITHHPGVPEVGDFVRAEVDTRRQVTWLSGGPPTFRSYVNTRTRQAGVPLHWASGCVFLQYDIDGTSHLDGNRELEIADGVFDHWETETASCGYLTFRFDNPGDVEVGNDQNNVLLFRDDIWCRPASGDMPEMCYSPAAAGLTTLFFVDSPGNSRDGEIVDADIELNGVHFAISDGGQSNGTPQCLSDLSNTLTHEVGHFIGLDHTCWDGTLPRPIDDEGNNVPSCTPESALPPDITEATMYNFQACGETKKASLTGDEVAGFCSVYPTADDPGECARVDLDGDDGCCTVAPSSHRGHRANGGALFLGVLALLGLVAIREVSRTRAGRASSSSARS